MSLLLARLAVQKSTASFGALQVAKVFSTAELDASWKGISERKV